MIFWLLLQELPVLITQQLKKRPISVIRKHECDLRRGEASNGQAQPSWVSNWELVGEQHQSVSVHVMLVDLCSSTLTCSLRSLENQSELMTERESVTSLPHQTLTKLFPLFLPLSSENGWWCFTIHQWLCVKTIGVVEDYERITSGYKERVFFVNTSWVIVENNRSSIKEQCWNRLHKENLNMRVGSWQCVKMRQFHGNFYN